MYFFHIVDRLLSLEVQVSTPPAPLRVRIPKTLSVEDPRIQRDSKDLPVGLTGNAKVPMTSARPDPGAGTVPPRNIHPPTQSETTLRDRPLSAKIPTQPIQMSPCQPKSSDGTPRAPNRPLVPRWLRLPVKRAKAGVLSDTSVSQRHVRSPSEFPPRPRAYLPHLYEKLRRGGGGGGGGLRARVTLLHMYTVFAGNA